MPLRKGTSRRVQEENFHELRHGRTYARTAKKFGKEKAQAQMEAIVLTEKRKSAARNRRLSKEKL